MTDISNATEQLAAKLFDVDMEQACIGAMLVDGFHIERVHARCEPEDFYDPLHQRIVACIFLEHESGHICSALTIGVQMSGDDALREIGGKAYLISLSRAASAMPNTDDYGRLIASLSDKRSACWAMAEAQDGIAGGAPLTAALTSLMVVSQQSEARNLGMDSTRSLGEAGQTVLREVEEGAHRRVGMRAPSGLSVLDEIIGGLYPATLTVAGGRPGMGKSILGTTIARAAAQAGWAPHLFSLEMAARENAARLLCDMDYDHAVENGIKPIRYADLLHHKAMDDSQWARMARVRDEFESLMIEINDHDRLTIQQIAALALNRANRIAASKIARPPLVIIDHLHIIEPSSAKFQGRRVDEISEITKAAKQLAKRGHMPVVLLAQLNRAVEGREDKVPVVSDFRDSGSVEQDADVILGLYRPAFYAALKTRLARSGAAKTDADASAWDTRNTLQIEVLKNRNGPTKQIECFVDVASAAIRDSDPAMGQHDRQMEMIR